jgi:hypothetical protein
MFALVLCRSHGSGFRVLVRSPFDIAEQPAVLLPGETFLGS